MRAFTKIILAAALFAVSLGMASAVSGPRLNVHIKDQLGGPVQGAQVAAIEFGMNGPSTYTVIGVTNSFGIVQMNLVANKNYNLYYSSQGYSPSISDQFNNPAYDPDRNIYAMGSTIYYSTFTLTSGLTGVGRLVQEFTGATVNKVLFGGVYNMTSQMQAGSGIVMTDGSGNGTLVVDNVPYADANTYNIGLYDPALNRGIGRNVMSPLDGTSLLVYGARTVAYTDGAKLDFNQSVPPTRVENTAQQQGGAATGGASVEGLIVSTNSTPIPHLGIGVKACIGNQWNTWANSDDNGRFQLYGLTPGVTYYLQVMGGCTYSQNGPGACYEPYSSSNYDAQDICAANNSLATANDIVYVSSDVMFHRVTLNEMPKSTGQIRVYVKSSSGFAIPNANVNISPDGTPWGKTGTSCAGNDFSDYSSNPGFSNANVNTSATGYALLDGLPSGNYNINVWTPFSSGGGSQIPYNGNGDDFTAFGNNGGGGNWQQAHCYGTGANDYRVTVDTNPATNGGQTMHVYNSSGTEVGLSSITYIVAVGGNATGEVKGSVKFSGVADLSNSPIMITLYPQCTDGMCQGTGNFVALTGSGADHYNYSIKVASGAAYYMNVNSVAWGRVNRGGGDNTIHLESTGTVVLNLEFAPAGTITGTVYKPDGTIFTPATNQYISVNAGSNNGWSGAQVQKDGTFTMTDVLPGVNKLSIYAGGSVAFNYALPSPVPTVIVAVNATSTVNLNLVNGTYVGPVMTPSMMPDTTNLGSGSNPLLGFKVLPVPAGTVFTGANITKMLTGGDDKVEFRYSTGTHTGEDGPCGQAWPGGFCALNMPSPSVYDFYLVRFGDFGKEDAPSGPLPYPHFTVITSSKSIIIDSAHANGLVRPQMSMTLSSGVVVNLNPAESMAGRGNATLTGEVSADNFFRQVDFDATGGDFDKFTQYLPVVSLYDDKGAFKAAGIVIPPPAFIATHEEAFNTSFAQGYDAFRELLASSDAHPFGYEIRDLAPGACYTEVVTTPNYPPYQTKVCMGGNGTTKTVDVINLDAFVGATLQGVVTSTDTAVELANADVEISGEGIDARSVVTNSSGAYKFEGLPSGTVRIKVAMSGYALGEVEKDLSDASTFTQNFLLTAAAGSITGTVYSQKLPFAKVQPGALIYAYDDTYNGTHDTVPLLKTITGSDGTYTLTGLIEGDIYKVFLKVPGKYTLKLSTPATAGVISGMDFTMLAKPLDIEIFAKCGDILCDFTVLNPQDFKEGSAKWSVSPYNSGSAVELSLEKLSSGELRGTIPVTSLTPGITYVLHGDATSYSNKTVTKEILFGTDYKGNSEQNIDDIILGDDSDDGTGRRNNEAFMDQSGDDQSALSFPAGVIQISTEATAAIPSCTFKGEDKNSDAVAAKVDVLGADAFAGNVYTIALTSVTINDDKSFEVTLAYDKTNSDLNDLSVAQYNAVTAAWENVPGVATINPVKGTVKVKLKTLASILSVKGGAPHYSVASFNGREYVMKPLASSTLSTSGTFAVVKPSYTGGGLAAGAKLKVFNYPNPFNLKDKAIGNNHASADLPTSTYGTVIHVEVPSGNGGPGHIRIYTLAGELVRDLSADFTAGSYNYVIWNGRNKSGQEVANGVYYGIIEMTGKKPKLKDATFKMAVIK